MQPYVVSEPVVSVPVKKKPPMKLTEKTLKRIRRMKAEEQRRRAKALERQLAKLRKPALASR